MLTMIGNLIQSAMRDRKGGRQNNRVTLPPPADTLLTLNFADEPQLHSSHAFALTREWEASI
jgi:hypothetical protein